MTLRVPRQPCLASEPKEIWTSTLSTSQNTPHLLHQNFSLSPLESQCYSSLPAPQGLHQSPLHLKHLSTEFLDSARGGHSSLSLCICPHQSGSDLCSNQNNSPSKRSTSYSLRMWPHSRQKRTAAELGCLGREIILHHLDRSNVITSILRRWQESG